MRKGVTHDFNNKKNEINYKNYIHYKLCIEDAQADY